MVEKTLTTGEVGRYCGVHLRTVLRWIEQGRLKAFKLPGRRGDNRVLQSELLAFLKANNMPVPSEFQQTARRVLVVDDDRLMAQSMQRVLRHAGFEVQVALDGLQAGVLLQSFAPAVMTLDLKMPGMDGHEVLRFIRSRAEFNAVRVLVVSALPQAELLRAQAAGADDILEKPFEQEALIQKVTALADAAGYTGEVRHG